MFGVSVWNRATLDDGFAAMVASSAPGRDLPFAGGLNCGGEEFCVAAVGEILKATG
jgi:hypothetical protein